MKIRKLNGEDHMWNGSLCFPEMQAVGQVIEALNIAQNSTAPMLEDSGWFQNRCADAIVALANKILETVEAHYVPETKKFRVKYCVERAGTHEFEVEAESKKDALEKADDIIAHMPEQELQDLNTEFTGTDVISAEEVNADN